MLPLVDSQGRIHVSTLPVVTNVRGIGYAVDGSMVVTPNLTPLDVWVGGWRLDPIGRVCYAPPGGPVVWNSALPFLISTGQLVATVDTVPQPSDPYNASIRVSETSGAYFTTSSPVFVPVEPGDILTDELFNPLVDELDNQLTG